MPWPSVFTAGLTAVPSIALINAVEAVLALLSMIVLRPFNWLRSSDDEMRKKHVAAPGSGQRPVSYQPRATPWGHRHRRTFQALEARFIRSGYLVPHVSLVKVHAIFAQQFAVFFLKRFRSVMRFLFFNITHQFIELTVPDR